MIPAWIWVVIAICIAIAGVLLVLLAIRARQVNLTRSESPDEVPEWMTAPLPPETIAETEARGEGVALYGHDEGEHVAAPFVEQIEDILHVHMREDPQLAGLEVDLGTAPDGSIEIWVDGERYGDIEQVPNERLRQAFHEAVARWEETQKE